MNVLEVCAGDIDSVKAAAEGGAQRVELCSALSEGGVTPSIGFIRKALDVSGIKVHVLIRPRNGDFLYSDDEIRLMIEDIVAVKHAGAHGVVIGALTPSGNIDIEACKRMVAAAEGLNVTFHRAFDLCKEPLKALDEIIEIGCNRLLTSGQAATALEGVDLLRQLTIRAGKDLTILAGGGVTPENAAEILNLSGTNEIHASARETVKSKMEYRKGGVSMGATGSDEYTRKVTSSKIVSEIVRAINFK
ncbi:MAG: copper homeostasis protein CutC [Paramuribaculum sp.]|nr:copper homeostasis protein CutC [Paramuribaculum sp.]